MTLLGLLTLIRTATPSTWSLKRSTSCGPLCVWAIRSVCVWAIRSIRVRVGCKVYTGSMRVRPLHVARCACGSSGLYRVYALCMWAIRSIQGL